MLIGLDCAEPSLVLERWRDELPTISGLMERGTYGRLTSVIPPITVPAWSCMMSSKTPGDLGVYGFRGTARITRTTAASSRCPPRSRSHACGIS
jgi:predicted AlkP superfamily phosphohydrolase/phosphomutase